MKNTIFMYESRGIWEQNAENEHPVALAEPGVDVIRDGVQGCGSLGQVAEEAAKPVTALGEDWVRIG